MFLLIRRRHTWTRGWGDKVSVISLLDPYVIPLQLLQEPPIFRISAEIKRGKCYFGGDQDTLAQTFFCIFAFRLFLLMSLLYLLSAGTKKILSRYADPTFASPIITTSNHHAQVWWSPVGQSVHKQVGGGSDWEGKKDL